MQQANAYVSCADDARPTGLDVTGDSSLADVPFPRIEGSEHYEACLTTWLHALCRAPAAARASNLAELARRKCDALGLDRAELDAHLRRGLRQHGALGPDEQAEYDKGLARLFGHPAPEQLDLSMLARGLSRLAEGLCRALGDLARDHEALPIFLGTDAEYQKLVFDMLTAGQRRARAFYVSRLSLMTDAECEVLWHTREAVCGPSGKTRSVADGSTALREYSWMDNSLVSAVTYQLIQQARGGDDTSGDMLQRLAAAMHAELFAQPVQKRMLAQGTTTFFGQPHGRVAEVIREGVLGQRFAHVVGELACRFARTLTVCDAPKVAIVDVGATGTQPLLIAASLRALCMATPRELRSVPALAPYVDELRALSSRLTQVHVHLFCPRPDEGRDDGAHLTRRHASWEFAMAVETMKTVTTSYDGRRPEQALQNVSPDQELLGYVKQLVFRDVASRWRAGDERDRVPTPTKQEQP